MKLSSEQILELREPVIAIARNAGTAIMRVYAESFSVQEKSDRSPLTQADLAAHQIIQNGLTDLRTDWPVLSEESAPEDILHRKQWPIYWLVDPLDGTREFVKRNGEFTVNIALIENNQVVFGVIFAPALDELVWAIADVATFKRVNNLDLRLRVKPTSHSEAVRVVGSRSHQSEAEQAVFLALGEYQHIAVGSSLKFIRIAEGAADVYFRLGPTSEWDTAAGQVILEAAGGTVRNLRGEKLTCNSNDTLLNPYFIASADTARAWPVAE